jgi:hypothetical protein
MASLPPGERFSPDYYASKRYVIDPATGRIVEEGSVGQPSQPVSIRRYANADISTVGLGGPAPGDTAASAGDGLGAVRDKLGAGGSGGGMADTRAGWDADVTGEIHNTSGSDLSPGGAIGDMVGSDIAGQVVGAGIPGGGLFGMAARGLRAMTGPYGLVGMEDVGIGHPAWDRKQALINEMKEMNAKVPGVSFGNFLHDITGGLLGEERSAGPSVSSKGDIESGPSKGRGGISDKAIGKGAADRAAARGGLGGGGQAGESGGGNEGARDNDRSTDGRDHQGW